MAIWLGSNFCGENTFHDKNEQYGFVGDYSSEKWIEDYAWPQWSCAVH
jgi:hypothetical protein